MLNWTNDGGDGVDDYAVFVFSTGEVLVYQGDDPGNAAAWSLIGRFQIGEPLGIRAHAKVGGPEIIGTTDGYVDLSIALRDGRYSEQSAYSSKIIRAAKDAARDYAMLWGWEMILYPAGQQFIVNVPIATDAAVQHVRETSSGGWCERRLFLRVGDGGGISVGAALGLHVARRGAGGRFWRGPALRRAGGGSASARAVLALERSRADGSSGIMERAELSDRLSARRPRIRSHRPVVVCERDPVRFQAAFAAGVAGAGLVFLADPAWGAAERAQFRALVARAPDRPAPARGWLCIPTGGSSGALRLARHDGETLAAAVGGFSRHFYCPVVSTCGILPLHHVSGLMGWLRVALTDGRFVSARWTEVESGALPAVPDGDGFVSVVPTQLQRLLARAGTRAWLRRFRAVFVGGGPAWPQLLDDAARAKVPLSLSYGMTETAAMVAALRPEEFAAGDRSCGRPLPHVRVRTRHDGTVTVAGASLFRGYYPAWVSRRAPWVTQDVGFFDPSGALHIEGRRDSLIISGGEKVDPFQVESALRATGEFADVAVLGVPDPEWGASVVACYPMKDASPDWDRVQRRLRRELAAYRRPKRYVGVVDWPRNAQGKLNRATLLRLAQERIARGGFIAG